MLDLYEQFELDLFSIFGKDFHENFQKRASIILLVSKVTKKNFDHFDTKIFFLNSFSVTTFLIVHSGRSTRGACY